MRFGFKNIYSILITKHSNYFLKLLIVPSKTFFFSAIRNLIKKYYRYYCYFSIFKIYYQWLKYFYFYKNFYSIFFLKLIGNVTYYLQDVPLALVTFNIYSYKNKNNSLSYIKNYLVNSKNSFYININNYIYFYFHKFLNFNYKL